MKLRQILVAFVTVGALVACGSDDEVAQNQSGAKPIEQKPGDDTLGACPALSDGPCPAGCEEGLGNRYDRTRKCSSPRSVVSCFKRQPGPIVEVGYCLVRSDGVVANVTTGFGESAFTYCDTALTSEVMMASACP